jgi:membrane-bound metal-dependent hydrolase YbcI (DUF457 family)
VLGKTHLFYGLTAGAALVLALAHPSHWLYLAEGTLAGGVGALLPDLDEPGSTISNAPRIMGRTARRLLRGATRQTPLRLLGQLVGLLIGLIATILNVLSRGLSHLVRLVSGGHREGSHWLPLWAGLSIAVYALTTPAFGPWIGIGFSVGYLSHLLSDGCTRSGIPLVPRATARLHLLPRPLRVRTGTGGETAFTLLYTIALVAVVWLILRQDLTALAAPSIR